MKLKGVIQDAALVITVLVTVWVLAIIPLQHQEQLRQEDTNALAKALCGLRVHSLATYKTIKLPLEVRRNAYEAATFYGKLLQGLHARPPTRCKNEGDTP